MTCLLLSFWHLFNEDPGRCNPACMCVSTFSRGTLSNPESYSHLSLVNAITVTFNVAVTVKIFLPADCHVDCTVNGSRRAALGAIELKIPAATAVVTAGNPEVTGKVDMEGSVCVLLHEFTVLSNQNGFETKELLLGIIVIIICKEKSYKDFLCSFRYNFVSR